MRTGTSATSVLTTLFTAFALMACGGDDSTDPGNGGGGGGGGNGGGDAEPAAVTVVSGDNQTARTGVALTQPFVVRVTDAEGTGVAGVSVSWSVTSGPGSVTASSVTDAQGQAQATFTAGAALGTTTVEATVPDITESVEFTVETSVMLIRMQGTAFVAPGGGDDVTVPVGTMVQWENFDAVQHTATSSDVPAGGAEIDTGLMGNGDTESFTPNVEGTWTYFCEVHPGIMVGATITAAAPTGSSTGSGDDGGTTGPGDDYPGGG